MWSSAVVHEHERTRERPGFELGNEWQQSVTQIGLVAGRGNFGTLLENTKNTENTNKKNKKTGKP